MSDSYAEFNSRINKINRTQARKDDGYTISVRKDGLIVFKPKKQHYSSRLPFRGLLLLIVGGFLFKGLILAQVGTAVYEERVVRLTQSSFIEQAGAYVMQIDPVSMAIATKLRRFLK